MYCQVLHNVFLPHERLRMTSTVEWGCFMRLIAGVNRPRGPRDYGNSPVIISDRDHRPSRHFDGDLKIPCIMHQLGPCHQGSGIDNSGKPMPERETSLSFSRVRCFRDKKAQMHDRTWKRGSAWVHETSANKKPPSRRMHRATRRSAHDKILREGRWNEGLESPREKSVEARMHLEKEPTWT